MANGRSAWLATAILTPVLVANAGCEALQQFNLTKSESSDSETALVHVQDEDAWSDRSPTEWSQVVIDAAQEYQDSERLFQTAGGQFRLATMRRKLEEQLHALRMIEIHDESTADQRAYALQRQAELLALGANQNWEGYASRLGELKTRLQSDATGSNAAAVADAAVIWGNHFKTPGDLEAAAAAVEQHAQTYPNSDTGPRLYAQLAEILLQRNDIRAAKDICQTVAGRYEDAELRKPMLQVLERIQRLESEKSQRAAYYRTRAQEFGGHLDGYFVLFLRPTKLRYMSQVDYVVAHGLEEAIHSADGAEKWVLEGWFPEGRQGLIDANELAQQLMKKNTISMPTFN